MTKQNTFFAAASWYDDNDAEPYNPRQINVMKGVRCPRPNGEGCFTAGPHSGVINSYLITDKDLIERIKRYNEKIMAQRKKDVKAKIQRFDFAIKKQDTDLIERRIQRLLPSIRQKHRKMIDDIFYIMHPLRLFVCNYKGNFNRVITLKSERSRVLLRTEMKKDFVPVISPFMIEKPLR